MKVTKVKGKIIFGKPVKGDKRHSKKKMSKNKRSHLYHKPYRGQGR